MKTTTTLILLFTSVFCGATAFANKPPIKVISYNILNVNWNDGKGEDILLWSSRRQLVFSAIEAQVPDIVGLQEVDIYQYNELKRHFGTTYELCWAENWIRPGEFRNGNAIMYNKARFQSSAGCDSELLPTTLMPGETYNIIPRSRIWVKLTDKYDTDGNNAFIFMNTHYDWADTDAPIASSHEIMNFRITEAADLPVILTGDFNARNDPNFEPDEVPPLWSGLPLMTHEELEILTAAATYELTYTDDTGEPIFANVSWSGDQTFTYTEEQIFNNVFWPYLTEGSARETTDNPNGLCSTVECQPWVRIDHIFATQGVNASNAFFLGDEKVYFDNLLLLKDPIKGSLVALGLDGIKQSYPSDHLGIGVSLVLPD